VQGQQTRIINNLGLTAPPARRLWPRRCILHNHVQQSTVRVSNIRAVAHSRSTVPMASANPDHCVQLDLSRGILAAMPGWVHVRLLAPHADVRLLVCGQSTLVDSHRLRCTALLTPLDLGSWILGSWIFHCSSRGLGFRTEGSVPIPRACAAHALCSAAGNEPATDRCIV